ncbi:MAG: cadmium-containing carbonic anhydrase [Patescibacteria group bacterium]
MVQPPNFETYLLPADLNLIRCVDERQAEDATNGIELPGGTYSIIDFLKTHLGISEEEAWEKAQETGIPMGGHVDNHHGPQGCGYAKLVETNPQAVSAPEAVPAASRLAKIEEAPNGQVMHYLGEHRPTHAVINHRVGFSLDPDKAVAGGLGIFNFDAWAVSEYAQRLGVDPQIMTSHLLQVYRQTVTALTGITTFYEIK